MGILKNWIPPDGSDFKENNFKQSSGIQNVSYVLYMPPMNMFSIVAMH